MSTGSPTQIDRVAVSHGELQVQRLGGRRAGPTLVFLHEGLGSVQHWRGFPDDVVAATGLPGLVYSRFGHGWSSAPARSHDVRFMYREAEILAALLHAEGITEPILVGHSDGASIALLAAAAGAPAPLGLVAMAPHVLYESFIEPELEAALRAWQTTDWPAKLGRYHADAQQVFRLWYDIWSSPDFHAFDITDELPSITCPVLSLQGLDDEYGTMIHLDQIEACVSGPHQRVEIVDCGHSPHRSQPAQTLAAVSGFITALT